MTTALIVVDVQNDFAHPDGNLYVKYGEYVAGAVNELLEHYEVVAYTRDFHPPVTKHFASEGGPWPEHCVGGTWGAEFFDELNVLNDGLQILKGTDPGEDGYSGFNGERDGEIIPTGLDNLLRQFDVDAVDIVGLAYDVCVKATALDAVKLGYKTRVIKDAAESVFPDHERFVDAELRSAGVEVV